jgi:hypothetical protein
MPEVTQPEQQDRDRRAHCSFGCAPGDVVQDHADPGVRRREPGEHCRSAGREPAERALPNPAEDGAGHPDREYARCGCHDAPRRAGRPAPLRVLASRAPRTRAAWKAAMMRSSTAAVRAAPIETVRCVVGKAN